jgi:hypothetical protein
MGRNRTLTLLETNGTDMDSFHEVERTELFIDNDAITEVTYSGAQGKLYYFRKEADSNPISTCHGSDDIGILSTFIRSIALVLNGIKGTQKN